MRGGIAVLLHSGIHVVQHRGNEFAQVVMLQGRTSARASVCNVHMPPSGNLSRRSYSEEFVREQVEEVLGSMPSDQPAIMCGDFNARTAAGAPKGLRDQLYCRQSADSQCYSRG